MEETLYRLQPDAQENSQETSSLAHPKGKHHKEQVAQLKGRWGQICKALGIARPRSKYRKWKQRYIGYSKMRKKTIKIQRSLTRALLKLLHKLLAFVKQLQKQHRLTLTELKRHFQK